MTKDRLVCVWGLWQQGTTPCVRYIYVRGPATKRYGSFCGTVCTLPLFPTLRHRGAPRKYLACVRQQRILKQCAPGIGGYVYYCIFHLSISQICLRSNSMVQYLNDDQPIPTFAQHEQQEQWSSIGVAASTNGRNVQQQHLHIVQ